MMLIDKEEINIEYFSYTILKLRNSLNVNLLFFVGWYISRKQIVILRS